jgi:hypothetical protein
MPGIIPGITIFGGIIMNTDEFVLSRIKEIVDSGYDPNGVIERVKDMVKEKEESTAVAEYVPSDYEYIMNHLIESLVDASWMLTEVSSNDKDVEKLIKDEIEDGIYSVSVRNFKVSQWFYRLNVRQILGFGTKSIEIGIGEYKPDSYDACFIVRHKYTVRIIFNNNNELCNVVSNTDADSGIMEWASEIYNKEITEFLKAIYYIIEKHRNNGTLKTCVTATNKNMSAITI